MSGRSFIDTNIFVYALDSRGPEDKSTTAKSLIRALIADRTGVISYQMVTLFQNLPPQNGTSSAEALLLFILILPFLIYNANNIRKQRLGL